MAGIQIDGVNNKIDFDDDADTSISSATDDTLVIESGGVNIASITSGEFAINEGSGSIDFRAESNSNTHMFFIDGSADKIGINESSPTTQLQITGATGAGGTIALKRPNTTVTAGQTLGGIEFITADSGSAGIGARILGEGDGTGGEAKIVFATGSGGSTVDAMTVGSGSHVGIGVETSSNKLRILQDQADENCVQIEYDTSSADESVMRWFCDRASSTAWDFLQAYSNNASSADLEFQMTSSGSMTADGSFSGSGADYAEYFETADGNGIEIGKTVVLDGNKVRASTSSDDASAIIGVVRPKEDGKCSMTIGNTAWNHWTNKYLTDDFGVFIWEDYIVKEWTEKTTKENGNIEVKNHSYPFDSIPEGVTVPDDAKEITQQRKKQNPDWNEDTEYVKRQDRKEWVIIGLLGQIPINKNEKTGTNWIKMRDISETVEEWLVR